jgi:hypothetical protein
LNSLADWQLRFAQDRDAARAALEQIVARLPDTELSALAAQRIAHLADTDFLLSRHEPKKIKVAAGVNDIGLLAAGKGPKAPDADPERQAAEFVAHLEAHPLDTEAREKLAVIYADHYGRLDLAADQFEEMIGHPNQPPKRVINWLNSLADLQLRHNAPYETVHATVQRIVDLFPGTAAAATAMSRLDHLKLELKGQTQGASVKLGTYEQDIGLKRSLPHQL